MGYLVSHRSLPNSGPFNCPMYDVMSSSLSPCPHACREGVRGLYVLLECCKMMDNELKAVSLFLFANLVSKVLLKYVCSAHCSHYAHMYREGVRCLYFCCTLCSHSVSRCILCILCVFLQVFLMPRTTGLLCWREVEASVRYVYDCIVWRVVCTYMGCNSVSVDCFRESGHLLNARV